MTDAPKLHAYVVTLNFGEGGPLLSSVLAAPDAVSAAALTTVAVMQERPVMQPLHACLAFEVELENLRNILRAVEGKLPESGTNLFSLVPKGSVLPASIGDEQIRTAAVVPGGLDYGEPFGPPIPPGAA